MQQLPYVVVTNPHINDVYNLYYDAFDSFRGVKEIKTLEDNDRLCQVISNNLKKHLTVIPKLAMGILECEGLVDAKEMDKFMNTVLRSVSWPLQNDEAIANQTTAENFPSCYCRAAPVPHRNLQLALLLPWLQALGIRRDW